LENIFSSKDIR